MQRRASGGEVQLQQTPHYMQRRASGGEAQHGQTTGKHHNHHHHHQQQQQQQPESIIMEAEILCDSEYGDPKKERQQPQQQRQLRPQTPPLVLSSSSSSFRLGQLEHRLLEVKAAHPLRIWVIDNSGSMLAADGRELRNVSNCNCEDDFRLLPCTRWQELKSTTIYHAKLAAAMNAPTIFRLLNNPGSRVGPQTFSVAMSSAAAVGDNNTTPASVQQLEQDLSLAVSVLENAQPNGGTPLLHHLREIYAQIRAMESSLRRNCQAVVLVLATDGLPTDAHGETSMEAHQEFIRELKALQSLPVWIVVRLCTGDPFVVEFYNGLDAQLEFPLDVIDDFYGEARQVQSYNTWLNYSLVLHRCREMGYHHRLFDLLDERLLNKDELREFLVLLFDEETIQPLPDGHGDWKGFVAGLTHLMAATSAEDKQYNVLTNKLAPWIDIKQLKLCYNDRRRFSLLRWNSWNKRRDPNRRSTNETRKKTARASITTTTTTTTTTTAPVRASIIAGRGSAVAAVVKGLQDDAKKMMKLDYEEEEEARRRYSSAGGKW